MSRPHLTVRPFPPLAASLCTVASCVGLLALQGCGGNVGTSSVPIPTSTGGSTGNSTPGFRQAQLGYAWLPKDQTLRPVIGVMGAAYLGESVVGAGTYATGAASASAQVALLVDGSGFLSRLSLADGTVVPVGQLSGAAVKIHFSPSGTAAVAFAPGASAVTLITGLRSTVQIRSLPAAGAVQEVAVSDAGSVAALLPSQGKALVSLLRADGTSSRISSLSGPGSLTFVGVGDDLLVADTAANALTLLHTVSTAPSPVSIATGSLLKAPNALGAAATGRWAVAVNSAEASVVRVDVTGQVAPQRLVVPTQPLFAEPLAYGAFRFSDAGAAPTWVTDITAATPTLFFVPALPSTAAAGM